MSHGYSGVAGMFPSHQQVRHLRGGFSVHISRVEFQIGGEGVGVGSYHGVQNVELKESGGV
jgi:hypothetical protein